MIINKKTVLIAVLVFLCTAAVYAHRITVFGWVEGDTVYLEGNFSGGTKPKDAVIQVFDPDENLLHEGRTDENGEYNFKVPKISTLKVLINAGAGHQATCEIREEEIKAEMLNAGTTVTAGRKLSGGINQEALRLIVASEVDKKLKQFSRQLVLELGSSGEPSLPDILGGIGYIIGLVGLATYFHYRRKVKELE
jgi:nickel transport protein